MSYSEQVFYGLTINNLTATKILGNLSGGSFTTGTSAAWSTGISSGSTLVFTSSSAATNVSNLTAAPSAPSIAPVIVETDGGSPTTESAAVTFNPLAAGQILTMAGLTFTAGNLGATAAQLASAFHGILASSTLATLNTGLSAATGGTFTAGAPSGWTSGAASGAGLTFTSTTANTNVVNLSSALAQGTSAPGIVTVDGAAPGTTETAAVTFNPLAPGQTLTIEGLTFTAGSAGATAAQQASAFASIANGTTAASVNATNALSDAAGGTFTSGTSTGWASGAAAGAVVTFTSSTPNINVTNLTSALSLTASTPAITTTDGMAVASTETAAVTFQNMTVGQTLSIAGLTFTAGTLGATGDQVASAFSSLAAGTTADIANNIAPLMASAYQVTASATNNSTTLSGYITKPGDSNTYTFLATGSFTATATTASTLAAVKGSVTSMKIFINGALADSISYGGSVDDTMFGVTDSTVSPIPAATLSAQRAQAALQFNTTLSLINNGATFTGSNASNGGIDQVQGGISNDRFTGNGSNDYFDGKGGVDTAVYRGNFKDYTIASATTLDRTDPAAISQVAATTITDTVANRDGIDTLVNVERLEFADTILAYDTAKGSNAGDIYRLYRAAFNRAPDAAGLGYWINTLDNGSNTLVKAAQGFVNSAEFLNLSGVNSSNDTFITNLYQYVLHRAPDATGYQYWNSVLGTSTTARPQVLSDFSSSPENIAQVASLIANGIFYTKYVA
jgi:hypothetical protein